MPSFLPASCLCLFRSLLSLLAERGTKTSEPSPASLSPSVSPLRAAAPDASEGMWAFEKLKREEDSASVNADEARLFARVTDPTVFRPFSRTNLLLTLQSARRGAILPPPSHPLQFLNESRGRPRDIDGGKDDRETRREIAMLRRDAGDAQRSPTNRRHTGDELSLRTQEGLAGQSGKWQQRRKQEGGRRADFQDPKEERRDGEVENQQAGWQVKIGELRDPQEQLLEDELGRGGSEGGACVVMTSIKKDERTEMTAEPVVAGGAHGEPSGAFIKQASIVFFDNRFSMTMRLVAAFARVATTVVLMPSGHFSTDGTILGSGGDDKRVLLWHVGEPRNLPFQEIQTKHQENIFGVVFDSSDQYVLTCGNDGLVTRVSMENPSDVVVRNDVDALRREASLPREVRLRLLRTMDAGASFQASFLFSQHQQAIVAMEAGTVETFDFRERDRLGRVVTRAGASVLSVCVHPVQQFLFAYCCCQKAALVEKEELFAETCVAGASGSLAACSTVGEAAKADGKMRVVIRKLFVFYIIILELVIFVGLRPPNAGEDEHGVLPRLHVVIHVDAEEENQRERREHLQSVTPTFISPLEDEAYVECEADADFSGDDFVCTTRGLSSKKTIRCERDESSVESVAEEAPEQTQTTLEGEAVAVASVEEEAQGFSPSQEGRRTALRPALTRFEYKRKHSRCEGEAGVERAEVPEGNVETRKRRKKKAEISPVVDCGQEEEDRSRSASLGMHSKNNVSGDPEDVAEVKGIGRAGDRMPFVGTDMEDEETIEQAAASARRSRLAARKGRRPLMEVTTKNEERPECTSTRGLADGPACGGDQAQGEMPTDLSNEKSEENQDAEKASDHCGDREAGGVEAALLPEVGRPESCASFRSRESNKGAQEVATKPFVAVVLPQSSTKTEDGERALSNKLEVTASGPVSEEGKLMLLILTRKPPLVYATGGQFPLFELRSDGWWNLVTLKSGCFLFDDRHIAIGSEDKRVRKKTFIIQRNEQPSESNAPAKYCSVKRAGHRLEERLPLLFIMSPSGG
nr:hypothetical protein TgIb.1690c [Toxoplasma gondii RH]